MSENAIGSRSMAEGKMKIAAEERKFSS